MNWLITGGCGFLGTSLIKQLVAEGGHKIRVVDNLSVGSRDDLAVAGGFIELSPSGLTAAAPSLSKVTSDLVDVFGQPSRMASSYISSSIREGWGEGESVQFILGDVLDDKLALAVAQGADVIVHFAANTGVGPSVENPRMDCVTNVIGTFNYLEAARHNRIKRFVFASSGAPVGECEPPIHEEMVPHPVSPYGASKLAGEGYCSAYFRTYGIETVVLRFGNVYGPGSGHKNSVVAKFIKQALKEEVLEIYGDGSQTRDFIYIDDLIRAVQLAAISPNAGGEIFQIATNAETSVSELLESIISVFKEKRIVIPQVRYTEPRLGDVKRNFSDTSKAKKLLDWSAQILLDEGLAATVSYFE